MLRYIPPFILQRFDSQIYQGSLPAYVLLLDIADFTSIGMALQKAGKPGAEEISRFLDKTFGKPIEIVESYGGFVSLFAGDAFCAVFPDANPSHIISVVNSITAFFADKSEYRTPWGDFALKVRQTVCYGEVKWQIYRNELQCEYVFSGEVMQELAALSTHKADTVFSAKAANSIGQEHFEAFKDGFFLLSKQISSETNQVIYEYSPSAYDKFVNPAFRNDNPQNEFRSGAYCFISLEGVKPDKRESAIGLIQSLADSYGGFVNKYDATDKGLLAIILFGLPRSSDKTLDRICRFSLKAVESIPEVSLGIASGSVYSGYTGSGSIREYTALGHPVILAARLMGKAKAGEILTDHYLYLELHNTYEFDLIGTIALKGISDPICNYRLTRKSDSRLHYRESSFVGRDEEISWLKQIIDTGFGIDSNKVIYIVGDAGIGKSRLIDEVLSLYPADNYHKLSCYSDAVLKKPLELIRQLMRSYFGYSYEQTAEAGTAAFRNL